MDYHAYPQEIVIAINVSFLSSIFFNEFLQFAHWVFFRHLLSTSDCVVKMIESELTARNNLESNHLKVVVRVRM